MNEEMLYTLKLYCPLAAELDQGDSYDRWEDDPYNMDYEDDFLQLDGHDLTAYADVIREGIKGEALPAEAERGLMEYYHEADGVNDKVVSLNITVEEVDGQLYGVALCEVRDFLTQKELGDLVDYCSGQFSDGWGEGFEQRPLKTADGDLYVHFWQSGDKYKIQTKQALAAEKQRQKNNRNRGDAR